VGKRGRAVVSVRAPIDTGSPGSSLAW
jgi:hypothetical protein